MSSQIKRPLQDKNKIRKSSLSPRLNLALAARKRVSALRSPAKKTPLTASTLQKRIRARKLQARRERKAFKKITTLLTRKAPLRKYTTLKKRARNFLEKFLPEHRSAQKPGIRRKVKTVSPLITTRFVRLPRPRITARFWNREVRMLKATSANYVTHNGKRMFEINKLYSATRALNKKVREIKTPRIIQKKSTPEYRRRLKKSRRHLTNVRFVKAFNSALSKAPHSVHLSFRRKSYPDLWYRARIARLRSKLRRAERRAASHIDHLASGKTVRVMDIGLLAKDRTPREFWDPRRLVSAMVIPGFMSAKLRKDRPKAKATQPSKVAPTIIELAPVVSEAEEALEKQKKRIESAKKELLLEYQLRHTQDQGAFRDRLTAYLRSAEYGTRSDNMFRHYYLREAVKVTTHVNSHALNFAKRLSKLTTPTTKRSRPTPPVNRPYGPTFSTPLQLQKRTKKLTTSLMPTMKTQEARRHFSTKREHSSSAATKQNAPSSERTKLNPTESRMPVVTSAVISQAQSRKAAIPAPSKKRTKIASYCKPVKFKFSRMRGSVARSPHRKKNIKRARRAFWTANRKRVVHRRRGWKEENRKSAHLVGTLVRARKNPHANWAKKYLTEAYQEASAKKSDKLLTLVRNLTEIQAPRAIRAKYKKNTSEVKRSRWLREMRRRPVWRNRKRNSRPTHGIERTFARTSRRVSLAEANRRGKPRVTFHKRRRLTLAGKIARATLLYSRRRSRETLLRKPTLARLRLARKSRGASLGWALTSKSLLLSNGGRILRSKLHHIRVGAARQVLPAVIARKQLAVRRRTKKVLPLRQERRLLKSAGLRLATHGRAKRATRRLKYSFATNTSKKRTHYSRSVARRSTWRMKAQSTSSRKRVGPVKLRRIAVTRKHARSHALRRLTGHFAALRARHRRLTRVKAQTVILRYKAPKFHPRHKRVYWVNALNGPLQALYRLIEPRDPKKIRKDRTKGADKPKSAPMQYFVRLKEGGALIDRKVEQWRRSLASLSSLREYRKKVVTRTRELETMKKEKLRQSRLAQLMRINKDLRGGKTLQLVEVDKVTRHLRALRREDEQASVRALTRTLRSRLNYITPSEQEKQSWYPAALPAVLATNAMYKRDHKFLRSRRRVGRALLARLAKSRNTKKRVQLRVRRILSFRKPKLRGRRSQRTVRRVTKLKATFKKIALRARPAKVMSPREGSLKALQKKVKAVKVKILRLQQAKRGRKFLRWMRRTLLKIRRTRKARLKRRQASAKADRAREINLLKWKQANANRGALYLANRSSQYATRQQAHREHYQFALERVVGKARRVRAHIAAPFKKRETRFLQRMRSATLRRIGTSKRIIVPAGITNRRLRPLSARTVAAVYLNKLAAVKKRRWRRGRLRYVQRRTQRRFAGKYKGNHLEPFPGDERFGPRNKYGLRAIPAGEAEWVTPILRENRRRGTGELGGANLRRAKALYKNLAFADIVINMLRDTKVTAKTKVRMKKAKALFVRMRKRLYKGVSSPAEAMLSGAAETRTYEGPHGQRQKDNDDPFKFHIPTPLLQPSMHLLKPGNKWVRFMETDTESSAGFLHYAQRPNRSYGYPSKPRRVAFQPNMIEQHAPRRDGSPQYTRLRMVRSPGLHQRKWDEGLKIALRNFKLGERRAEFRNPVFPDLDISDAKKRAYRKYARKVAVEYRRPPHPAPLFGRMPLYPLALSLTNSKSRANYKLALNYNSRYQAQAIKKRKALRRLARLPGDEEGLRQLSRAEYYTRQITRERKEARRLAPKLEIYRQRVKRTAVYHKKVLWRSGNFVDARDALAQKHYHKSMTGGRRLSALALQGLALPSEQAQEVDETSMTGWKGAWKKIMARVFKNRLLSKQKGRKGAVIEQMKLENQVAPAIVRPLNERQTFPAAFAALHLETSMAQSTATSSFAQNYTTKLALTSAEATRWSQLLVRQQGRSRVRLNAEARRPKDSLKPYTGSAATPEIRDFDELEVEEREKFVDDEDWNNYCANPRFNAPAPTVTTDVRGQLYRRGTVRNSAASRAARKKLQRRRRVVTPRVWPMMRTARDAAVAKGGWQPLLQRWHKKTERSYVYRQMHQARAETGGVGDVVTRPQNQPLPLGSAFTGAELEKQYVGVRATGWEEAHYEDNLTYRRSLRATGTAQGAQRTRLHAVASRATAGRFANTLPRARKGAKVQERALNMLPVSPITPKKRVQFKLHMLNKVLCWGQRGGFKARAPRTFVRESERFGNHAAPFAHLPRRLALTAQGKRNTRLPSKRIWAPQGLRKLPLPRIVDNWAPILTPPRRPRRFGALRKSRKQISYIYRLLLPRLMRPSVRHNRTMPKVGGPGSLRRLRGRTNAKNLQLSAKKQNEKTWGRPSNEQTKERALAALYATTKLDSAAFAAINEHLAEKIRPEAISAVLTETAAGADLKNWVNPRSELKSKLANTMVFSTERRKTSYDERLYAMRYQRSVRRMNKWDHQLPGQTYIFSLVARRWGAPRIYGIPGQRKELTRRERKQRHAKSVKLERENMPQITYPDDNFVTQQYLRGNVESVGHERYRRVFRVKSPTNRWWNHLPVPNPLGSWYSRQDLPKRHTSVRHLGLPELQPFDGELVDEFEPRGTRRAHRGFRLTIKDRIDRQEVGRTNGELWGGRRWEQLDPVHSVPTEILPIPENNVLQFRSPLWTAVTRGLRAADTAHLKTGLYEQYLRWHATNQPPSFLGEPEKLAWKTADGEAFITNQLNILLHGPAAANKTKVEREFAFQHRTRIDNLTQARWEQTELLKYQKELNADSEDIRDKGNDAAYTRWVEGFESWIKHTQTRHFPPDRDEEEGEHLTFIGRRKPRFSGIGGRRQSYDNAVMRHAKRVAPARFRRAHPSKSLATRPKRWTGKWKVDNAIYDMPRKLRQRRRQARLQSHSAYLTQGWKDLLWCRRKFGEPIQPAANAVSGLTLADCDDTAIRTAANTLYPTNYAQQQGGGIRRRFARLPVQLRFRKQKSIARRAAGVKRHPMRAVKLAFLRAAIRRRFDERRILDLQKHASRRRLPTEQSIRPWVARKRRRIRARTAPYGALSQRSFFRRGSGTPMWMVEPDSGIAYGLPLKKYRRAKPVVSGADQFMGAIGRMKPTNRAERNLRFRKYFGSNAQKRKEQRWLKNFDILYSNEKLSRDESLWIQKSTRWERGNPIIRQFADIKAEGDSKVRAFLNAEFKKKPKEQWDVVDLDELLEEAQKQFTWPRKSKRRMAFARFFRKPALRATHHRNAPRSRMRRTLRRTLAGARLRREKARRAHAVANQLARITAHTSPKLSTADISWELSILSNEQKKSWTAARAKRVHTLENTLALRETKRWVSAPTNFEKEWGGRLAASVTRPPGIAPFVFQKRLRRVTKTKATIRREKRANIVSKEIRYRRTKQYAEGVTRLMPELISHLISRREDAANLSPEQMKQAVEAVYWSLRVHLNADPIQAKLMVKDRNRHYLLAVKDEMRGRARYQNTKRESRVIMRRRLQPAAINPAPNSARFHQDWLRAFYPKQHTLFLEDPEDYKNLPVSSRRIRRVVMHRDPSKWTTVSHCRGVERRSRQNINLRYSRSQRRFETLLKTIARTQKPHFGLVKNGISDADEEEENELSFFARGVSTLARNAEPTLILRHIRRDLRFVRRRRKRGKSRYYRVHQRTRLKPRSEALGRTSRLSTMRSTHTNRLNFRALRLKSPRNRQYLLRLPRTRTPEKLLTFTRLLAQKIRQERAIARLGVSEEETLLTRRSRRPTYRSLIEKSTGTPFEAAISAARETVSARRLPAYLTERRAHLQHRLPNSIFVRKLKEDKAESFDRKAPLALLGTPEQRTDALRQPKTKRNYVIETSRSLLRYRSAANRSPRVYYKTTRVMPREMFLLPNSAAAAERKAKFIRKLARLNKRKRKSKDGVPEKVRLLTVRRALARKQARMAHHRRVLLRSRYTFAEIGTLKVARSTQQNNSHSDPLARSVRAQLVDRRIVRRPLLHLMGAKAHSARSLYIRAEMMRIKGRETSDVTSFDRARPALWKLLTSRRNKKERALRVWFRDISRDQRAMENPVQPLDPLWPRVLPSKRTIPLNVWQEIRRRVRKLEWQESDELFHRSGFRNAFSFHPGERRRAPWLEALMYRRTIYSTRLGEYRRYQFPREQKRLSWLQRVRKSLFPHRRNRNVYIKGRRWPRLRIYNQRMFRALFNLRNKSAARRHFRKLHRQRPRWNNRSGFAKTTKGLVNRLDTVLLLLRLAPTLYWARQIAPLGLISVRGEVLRNPSQRIEPGMQLTINYERIKSFQHYFQPVFKWYEKGKHKRKWQFRAWPRNFKYNPVTRELEYVGLPEEKDLRRSGRVNGRLFRWFALDSIRY